MGNIYLTRDNRQVQSEFVAIWEYCMKGFGVDLGCGGNRLSPDILAIDKGGHDRPPNGPDLVKDVSDLGAIGFHTECFDFIFSSHCLEDFYPIDPVLVNWWKHIKPGGYLVLLLPDMENGRYARVGDPNGNPSHKTNVGPAYMRQLMERLLPGQFQIVQCDTLKEGFTFDFVARKKGEPIA